MPQHARAASPLEDFGLIPAGTATKIADAETTPRSAQRTNERRFGGLENLLVRFEEMDDTSANLFAGYIRQKRPMFRGVPLTRMEVEEAQLTHEANKRRLLKESLSFNINQTVGWLTQNAQLPVPGDPQGRTLEEFLNVGTIDAGLLQEPEALVAVSQRVAQLPGLESLALSMQQLIMAELPAALKSPAARQAAKAQRTVGQEETARKLLEQKVEATEGGGASGQIIKSILEQESESIGQNLGTGIWSDIDEDRGAEGLLTALNSAMDVGERDFGISAGEIADTFWQINGENVIDQLEELPIDQATGLLSVGETSTFDVTRHAGGVLAEVMDRISFVSGKPIAELSRAAGGKFTGLDKPSLNAFRLGRRAAREGGLKEATVAADAGR
jgi:hypothetical protein